MESGKPMTITQLIERSFRQAQELGWTRDAVLIPEQVALIHSEASEALEAYRNHEPMSWVDDGGKPQGVASEFADILIRIGHYSAINGIDLESEVLRKLDYNMKRGFRHGGKAI